MRRPAFVDQYLLRRRDGSLELWVTDWRGRSRCRALWPLGGGVGHHFNRAGAWTLVHPPHGGTPTFLDGYVPEADEDGPCDCPHGCRWGR